MTKTQVKGTLAQCLQHFGQRIGVLPASHHLAEAAQANQQTASRWIRGIALPYGLKLIMVEHFLEGKGYVIDELQDMQPEVLDLRRLIANRFIQPGELNAQLGYANQAGLQSLYRILRGENNLVDERLDLTRAIIAQYESDLTRIRPGPAQPVTRANPQSSEQGVVQEASDLAGDPLIGMLGVLIKMALPLARDLESDKYTDTDREQLRQYVGGEEFFAFSTTINRLCGPRARAHFRGEPFDHGR